MKQILLNSAKISINLKRNYLASIFLLAFLIVNGQNGIIGEGFGTNNWSTTDNFLGGAGSSRIFTTTPNGTGNQYFRLVRNWSDDFTQFGPYNCIDTDWTYPGVVYGMSDCGSGAFFINCPNTTDNYVFKTPNGDVSKDLLYFRVQGTIRSVATVTQSPLDTFVTECHKTTVTATLDGALALGQEVYLRYTKDNFVNSVVVKLTGSGTTYSAEIPSSFNTALANVSYYVFTSGTITPSGDAADFYTINYNTNGGLNYTYSVAAGGATTYVPDDNFEQELITLGLDCTLDNYVFTSNISDITDLDVSSLGITDLTGIQGFSSLYGLICEDNLLTSLDVSALPNLRNLSMLGNQLVNASDLKAHPNLTYLDCDDNLFTSLDVSTLTNLVDLYCSGNQLTSLDVRGLANLQYFECTNNPSLSCILVDDVAAANTATTTISPENYPSQPYYYAKDATANYSYCDCDLTTTWTAALGGSWDNGAPTSATAAIIAYDYSGAANINACSLTVNANANVTIPSGYNVTLNAPLIVEPGSSFTLSNNSNLVQTNKKSINSGTITVNRNSNALHRLDFSLWSSPVTGAQTLAAFSPLTSQSPNRFYTFSPTANQYFEATFGSPFDLGTGYLIRMPNTDATPNYNSGTATLIFPGFFIGKPNNGTISVTTVPNKFNGIGNPYPSVIDADLFKASNTDINTLYFWRKTNNPLQGTSPTTSYAVYNIATATGTGVAPDGAATGEPTITPDKYIQVGQGFVVETAQTSVVFNNAMRVANNGNKFLKTKQIEKSRIWLNLSNPSWPINQIALCYIDGASVSLDETDSKYINDSPIALTSNINDEEYSIQGRPTFDATDVVALNFKTNVAGDYTIAIDHVDGLFSGSQDVYLADSKTGTETNLKTSSYNFTVAAGVDNARFSLKYQKTLKVGAPVFEDNSVSVYNNNGALYVNSKSAAISNIKVFDVQGRLLAEQKNVKSTTATINNLRANHQVLIVKIVSEDNKEVIKKLLN